MNLLLIEEVSASVFATELFIMIALLFLLGSCSGYLLEVLFRRFFSAKRWVNPGFMKGPYLPLYGFGLVLMFFISYSIIRFFSNDIVFYNPLGGLFNREEVSGPTIYDLVVILLMAISMILLEFIAGLIFVKGFHVRLWDYSNMKGNIMGIICPLFSLIWFAISVIYYYALNPFVYKLFWKMFKYIFGYEEGAVAAHFGLIFLLGIAYGVMLIDFITSIDVFKKISSAAKNSNVVAMFEKIRDEQKKQRKEFKERMKENIPQIFKDNKVIDEVNKKKEEAINKLKEVVLVDPSKTSTKENYDESGRPIKEEPKK